MMRAGNPGLCSHGGKFKTINHGYCRMRVSCYSLSFLEALQTNKDPKLVLFRTLTCVTGAVTKRDNWVGGRGVYSYIHVHIS